MKASKKKKVIIFGSLLGISLILLVATKGGKKDNTITSDVVATESETTVKDSWENYDNPILNPNKTLPVSDDTVSTSELFDNIDTSTLSIYPSPSYVSEKGDTLIYKKGIYKRVGFMKDEPIVKDTIVVDGIEYQRIAK